MIDAGAVRPATPADATAIAGVHAASCRTTYRGHLPDEVLARIGGERWTAAWTARLTRAEPRVLAFVIEADGGEVTGFSAAAPAPGRAWELTALYLLERAQRRGGGRRLFEAAMAGARAAGAESLTAWVLAANEPAHRFYRALGGQDAGSRTARIEGIEVVDLGYRWRCGAAGMVRSKPR